MPIQDKVVRYSVYVAHNDFVDFQRVIDLWLESGETATIAFQKDPPNDWLQFSRSHTTLYMLQDEFADVSGLLQGGEPGFPRLLHRAEPSWNSRRSSSYGTRSQRG